MSGRRALLALAGALVCAQTHAFPSAAGRIERPVAAAIQAPPLPVPERPTWPPAAPARLAIVIDDLGHDPAAGRRVIALPAAIGCAVLPGTPHARALAEAARAAGHEVLLHLPMQAGARPPARPYGLRIGMPPEALAQALARGLAAVPGAVGINNHQGSTLTAQTAPMGELMRLLAGRGLYFLDSRTTAATVAAQEAARAGVPVLERHVFLDHDADAAAVRAQLRGALARARRDGQALAIGHPYRATLAVLETELAHLHATGVELVAPSALLPQPIQARTQAPHGGRSRRFDMALTPP